MGSAKSKHGPHRQLLRKQHHQLCRSSQQCTIIIIRCTRSRCIRSKCSKCNKAFCNSLQNFSLKSMLHSPKRCQAFMGAKCESYSHLHTRCQSLLFVNSAKRQCTIDTSHAKIQKEC